MSFGGIANANWCDSVKKSDCQSFTGESEGSFPLVEEIKGVEIIVQRLQTEPEEKSFSELLIKSEK